jgi:serine phosphatase RsbU (regulator of sigma subunit)
MNGALLYAVIDLRRRTLTVANAGMIVPILLRDGALQFIEAYGLPLGSLAQARYAETCIDLQPGDRLILVSDGIVEAHNQWGDLFGFERLEQALLNAPAGAGPDALVQAVIDQVLAFAGPQAPHDDMTILALAPQLPR